MIVCSANEEHDQFTAWMPAVALCSIDSLGEITEIDPGGWRVEGKTPADGYTCAICGADAEDDEA